MANLSLCEIAQSQLSQTPIISGQLVCCTDTGNFYKDTQSNRISLSTDIIVVNSLPLAPITNKIYLLIPDKIYVYDGNDWNLLNEKPKNINILEKIEVALTTALKSNYDKAYTHSTQAHAPSNAQANVIEIVKVNGTALTPSSKAVNVIVPTKVSQLTNDAGYKTTDNNTTYDLGASASATNGNVKINMTGSNSTTDSVSVKGSGSVVVTSDADGIITVTGTDTKYSHPNSGVTAGTYKSVTVNQQGHVTAGTNPTTLAGYGITDAVKSSEKGTTNGIATLGSDGKVLSAQLPSYVDDVIEGYLNSGKFYKEPEHTTEITGEAGKIYVDLTSNKTYRWSGSAFVVISETIALGETSSTAYRGDRGKIAYDHSQSAHAPSNAEVNQNAFSKVTVGSTTFAAGAKTDTLTITAGNNVTITPDATNKKVTIAAKDTTYSAATTSAAGLMSATDKTKLDGIATGANNYVHPTSAGNKHIPSGGSSGQILRWSADGTAVWGNDNNTTYSAFKGATTDTTGGSGLVPTPAAGKQTSFLRGDATWVAPSSITAGAATKLATARILSLTGSVTGSGTFDGSGNLSISTTTNHTHKYAGSSSVGGSATSAVKLDTSTAGSVTQPVYFSAGKPVACTYTLGKSVPSNAVFTDTKVTQTLASSSASYPILLAPSGQTDTATTGSYFAPGLSYNPGTGVLTVSAIKIGDAILKYDSAKTALVVEFEE